VILLPVGDGARVRSSGYTWYVAESKLELSSALTHRHSLLQMKQIRKVLKKTKFDLGKRTGKEPSDATSIAPPASSLSQVDSGSGAIANFKDTVQPDKQSVEDPDRIATVESISPRLSSQDPQPGCSDVNHRPGYFAGASHVNASHGVFIDVGGDINITSEKLVLGF